MSQHDLHKSVQNVISDSKPNVRKSIVIGLGGSGMKGILSAKKWIESNIPLEAHRYMRWVGIDTTDIETSIEGQGGRYRFPSDQFLQEERRMLYVSSPTPSELSTTWLRDQFNNSSVYNWLPNPDVYDISTRSGQGANQTRALGRIAFFENEKRIRDALIKERDRLTELSDDPKYFQLLDVKEDASKHDDWIEFEIKQGVNRYYFYDKVPQAHTILAISPERNTEAVLRPHRTDPMNLQDFPRDEKGPYFEVPGTAMKGNRMKFRVRHLKRMGQISIFITCSIVGGTGNGMILDMAALVRDIFKDHWPPPRIYGILVLPSAFKRVVYNRNARANAYAALKEIDYFMSGHPFSAEYPDGRKVEIKDRLFNDGMLYLLDVENMAKNSLQGRDQVQELTGQFISTFIASTVGGAIEERMVNDSTRASVFLPKNAESPRRASFNSFGISRVIYPVPQLKDLGYRTFALQMVDEFNKPVDPRLLKETLGDLNRGLVRALRLNCRLIFERLYPDYKMDMEVEFRSYKMRLRKAIKKRDKREVTRLLENIRRDYGKAEVEKLRNNLVRKMNKRGEIELGKISTLLSQILHKFLKDPQRGFPFCDEMLSLVLAKLELYQQKYYREKVALARYDDQDLDGLLEKLEASPSIDVQMVTAFLHMSEFNFRQLVFESMLQAAEDFIRQFKVLLYEKKNNDLNELADKLQSLREELNQEITAIRFELLEKKNPLFFFLVNEEEIASFMDSYFYERLSLEDLCQEVDFVSMDREDNRQQLYETYLVYKDGLDVLDKDPAEIQDMIRERFAMYDDVPEEQLREKLFEDESPEQGLMVSEASRQKIEVESIRRKLFRIIHSRFTNVNFDVSIKQLLAKRDIPVRRLLEKLDTFSRPYIFLDTATLQSMEYYRTVTNFELDTYESGDDVETFEGNDLPRRLDHYMKRASARPNISVENFVVPNLCKPYEIISIGILLGFPCYTIESLAAASHDYHYLIEEKTHPLHLFNSADLDGRFFPDPFRTKNYLNPAHLYAGLIGLKLMEKTEKGYAFNKNLHGPLLEMQARESYKKHVLNLEKKLVDGGGIDQCSAAELAGALSKLALLARNPARKTLQFRREYALAIKDILDGEDTDQKAAAAGMSREDYLQKNVENPQFTDMGELQVFIDNEPAVRKFLEDSLADIFKKTRANESAGAAVTLPGSKINQETLPLFADRYAFYDYYEETGSLEWQNFLKKQMVRRLHKTVSSSRFRLEADPSLPDRNKISQFLDKLHNKMPEIVLWEVRVMNKIIG